MFNLSGSEIVVILLLALVVLGPEKLPDALRRAGRTYAELKKMGNSFQEEVKSALDEPMKEMKGTADLLRKAADFTEGSPAKPARPASAATTTPAVVDDPPPIVPAEQALDEELINRTLSGGTEPVDEIADAVAEPDGPSGDPTRTRNGELGAGGRRDLADMSPSFRRRSERPSMKTPDDVMTLTEHLGELRVRIIRSALAITVFAILIVAFYDQVLDFLLQPYIDLCLAKGESFCGFNAASDDPALYFFDPVEGLATRLRIASYGGLILAMPVVMWQIWRFIVPALHAKEKKYAIPFILSSVLLFLLGGLLAYLTLGKALEFLIAWAGGDVGALFAVSKYVRLVLLMVAAFGIGFQFPVLLVFLQLVGIVTPQMLIKGWRYAIVGIVVVAAVITPSGDPISLAALAVPMTILYVISVLIGLLFQRRKRRLGTAD